MVRKIRFEAWDAENKEMVGPYEVGSRLSMVWGSGDRQFIGLHDKNGREIYEDDMVRSGNDGMYSDTGDVLRVWPMENGFIEPFADDDDGMPYVKANLCEIIGNIYQNPELFHD